MTNLRNSSENLSKVRANTLFAARQILANQYPNTSKLFDHPDLLKRLERRLVSSGVGWIESCLDDNPQQTYLDQFPILKGQFTERFLHKLEDILDDPKSYYDDLRELVSSFDFSGQPRLRISNIIARTEDLRSLLLEVYIRREQS